MSEITELTEQIIHFRDLRDWKQFHTPKDMALSLILEAAELVEHFQWKNEVEITEHLNTHKQAVGEELADVLYWVLLLSHDLGIDLKEAFGRKMELNEKKYPVAKAKGKHLKHSEL
ncbi:nucleotide pyrophosphohydrolase [Oligoflexia bacterium]|nr:nucleotide pyrophosphohydrolase [Oligoflexia bacterium]